MRRKPRVLFAIFEAEPFLKTGGLGDVGGALPPVVKKAGCEIRVIMPKFGVIDEKYKAKMKHETDFYLDLGWRRLYCGIEKMTYKGVVYYFVDNEYYFRRDSAYGYYDDGERIAFFSKAVTECIQYLPDFKCDIIHCNDWHTALVPVFLREFYQGIPEYERIKTIFTVHNLKFQGVYSKFVLGDVLGLHRIPAAADQLSFGDDAINYMKGALCYSDILTTVSPTYSWEIRNAYFGEHLEDIFNRRSDVLYGILNGVDYGLYDPSVDKSIVENYDLSSLEKKKACKQAVQKELGLEVDPDIPLVVMVSRLTEQKGLDLIRPILDEFLDERVQFAVLGVGDTEYEDLLRNKAEERPEKMAACLGFNGTLSHALYAAGDMFLMPSKFEPCGLSQMIAMRYGNLPIVRETGGLKDSVTPYNKYTGEGTGFSFANYNAHELLYTLKEAIRIYAEEPEAWHKLIENAMTADFSWGNSAQKYMDLYRSICPTK